MQKIEISSRTRIFLHAAEIFVRSFILEVGYAVVANKQTLILKSQ